MSGPLAALRELYQINDDELNQSRLRRLISRIVPAVLRELNEAERFQIRRFS